METCPVCEGLTRLAENCPSCGAPMEDCGSVANYWDPYGPYEDQAPSNAASGEHTCVHFLQCPNCDENITRPVERDML